MIEEVRPGQTWRRRRDGMLAKIESVESESHGYVRWRPVEGGRLRWNWKHEITTGWDREEPHPAEAVAAALHESLPGMPIYLKVPEPSDRLEAMYRNSELAAPGPLGGSDG